MDKIYLSTLISKYTPSKAEKIIHITPKELTFRDLYKALLNNLYLIASTAHVQP